MDHSESKTIPHFPQPVNQTPATPPLRPLPSAELLRGMSSVEISHNGAVYRLQATRFGKLILTK